MVAGCGRELHITAREEYMHTEVTLQIKTTEDRYDDAQKAFRAAFSAIEEVEKSTSHFRTDSDVSQIRYAAAGTSVPVAESTWRSLSIAKEVYHATSGKYDVTVGPLVELWGFGTTVKTAAPSENAIAEVLPEIGFENVCFITATHSISSRIDSLHIDLSSVAKGVAVDRAFATLTNHGFYTVLVNAGGEIRVMTSNAPAWRIGIQVPDETASASEYIRDRIITLEHGSIATSGSYRRFLSAGGKHYSHVLDPHTGSSVTTEVVSVTVLARTCGEADALATAYFSLLPEEACALADAREEVSCFIVLRPVAGSSEFRMINSKGFPVSEN
jgi:FAD:protein FMN transferase